MCVIRIICPTVSQIKTPSPANLCFLSNQEVLNRVLLVFVISVRTCGSSHVLWPKNILCLCKKFCRWHFVTEVLASQYSIYHVWFHPFPQISEVLKFTCNFWLILCQFVKNWNGQHMLEKDKIFYFGTNHGVEPPVHLPTSSQQSPVYTWLWQEDASQDAKWFGFRKDFPPGQWGKTKQ